MASATAAELVEWVVRAYAPDSVLRGQAKHLIERPGATATIVEFEPGNLDPDPAVPDGLLPIRVLSVDPTGDCVGEVMVWVEGGVVTMLECPWYTDEPPQELPALESLQVMDD